MNFDDLRQVWKEEIQNPPSNEISFANIRKEVSKLDKKIQSRDRIETFACVGLLAVTTFRLATDPMINILSLLGSILIIATCIFIPFKLYRSKKVDSSDDWTLNSRMQKEIEKLEKQGELLSSVGIWYLSPISISIIFMSWGGHQEKTGTYVPDMSLLLYWLVGVVLMFGILWLNVRANRKVIQPALRKLNRLKNELEKES